MCPILFFSPWLQIFWCPRTAEKMNASILSTVLFCFLKNYVLVKTEILRFMVLVFIETSPELLGGIPMN